MPVPKKRQSKSQKNSKKFTWKKKASKQTNKALSKEKLVIKKLHSDPLFYQPLLLVFFVLLAIFN